MEPNSTSGFQFITSINTVARDDETRRKVRSHARRQKLTNNPSEPTKSGSQKDHTSRFRLKPTKGSEKQQEKKLSKANWLTVSVARELPNFTLLHIEKTSLTESLMKYCMAVCLSPHESVVERWFDRAGTPTYLNTYYSGFLANTFAMNPEGTWVEALQVDKAATHAFIAMLAAMHNALARWADTSTVDFHRFQAVKSINERLNLEGKDSNKPISDGLVVAVSLLVNIETFIGSLQAAAAHMSGLKRMVDLRGGIVEGFKHSSILQRSISWADYSYSTAAHQPLVFPFIPQLASSLPLHDRFMSRSMLANMEPLGLRDLTVQNREALELFELLYSITDCINTFDYRTLKSAYSQKVQVSNSIYLVEWRLCQLEQLSRSRQSSRRSGSVPLLPSIEGGRPPRQPAPTDLSDVLIYASHLFLHLAIRGLPPSAPRHRVLVESLMSALCDPILTLDLLSPPKPNESTTEGSLSRSDDPDPEQSAFQASTPRDELHANILLWALFLGACVRVPISLDASVLLGDYHGFFITALKNYCKMRGIVRREEFSAKLKDIVWIFSWSEHQLTLAWQEINDGRDPEMAIGVPVDLNVIAQPQLQ